MEVIESGGENTIGRNEDEGGCWTEMKGSRLAFHMAMVPP